MLAARVALNVPRLLTSKPFNKANTVQRWMSSEKTRLGHVARRRTVKEMASSPTTGAPFAVGQGMVAGASALGIGALAFYGLGFGNEAGAVEKSMLWPQHVKQRIRDTYMYFGASIGVAGTTAVAVFRSPTLMKFVASQGLVAFGVSIAALLGAGYVVRSIPYEEGFGKKQLAWLAYCGVVGTVLAPMCFLGGPILTRAAWYTAGIVGGLSTVAVTAPSDKFLYMGGPLAMGLGVVFMSSIASAFLPPTTALGAGVYSIALYGGLVLFSGFLLYDTQKIVYRAENHPNYGYGVQKYDPVNNSISIFMDAVNIFVRIAQILAMGGNRRK